jgi:hypothetical protein
MLRNAGAVQVGDDNSFPFEFQLATEVEEVPHLPVCDAHVVEELRFVLCGELGHGLDLDDDSIENDEIRTVSRLKSPTF